MLAKERLMICLGVRMSSVGENKERLNRAYDPVRLNTAPPIFAFSNELNWEGLACRIPEHAKQIIEDEAGKRIFDDTAPDTEQPQP